MDLQKFGVKLFANINGGYKSTDYIPVFHSWIQEKSIKDHLLIDVADYSHMQDGPGVMLVAHEGNISLDQEGHKPGIMYMRKSKIAGSFNKRFNKVLSISINAANLLCDNQVNKEVSFIKNSFRFIANDRLYAENTLDNQNLYKNKIQQIVNERYPNNELAFEDASRKNERLAFTVKFINGENILE